MTLVFVPQGRGITRNIVILDANEDPITPDAADLVRVRIGREGQADVLSVTSGTPTANGSRVTTGATNVMRLDAQDLTFPAGTYSLWVEYFDAADAQEWKEVDRQVFELESTETS
jgi:hypothetical protein